MQRELLNGLLTHLEKKEYSILTGARQTGKSTLLKALESHCREFGIPCVFLNLENKEILADLDKSPLNLLNYLPTPGKLAIALIDEVQYLANPSNFLKLLYDEHADFVKIVATGSSAFYIDDHFKDSLAGRKKLFQLLTCSFDEYLQLKEREDLLEERNRIISDDQARTSKIRYLQLEWEEYMLYGGYPAVITESNRDAKIDRLKEIRDSFVKRDILESGVQNETGFYNLFRLLAGQSGSLVNIHELSSTLRLPSTTIQHYLFILRKCFHLALVKPFFSNLRKELTRMPKSFLLDTGLRNCMLNNFQPVASRMDKGELWENVYFRVLTDRYGVDGIHYWRTADGSEVDFVIADIEKPFAIETKYDEALIKISKYKKFTSAYPDLPLRYAWLNPFDEGFFRRLPYV